nr:hypothetical protein [Kibdelosporangium sp. MJ126-NF4]CEL18896.1 hypothetical protein [Kibdelosporangium sp. MJ126-NF4]CTQ95300.1 hypothetical protein [Kibdelosporangium sp. MJ126-NF4]
MYREVTTMNCWAEIDDAEIKYLVCPDQQLVEFTIGHDRGLTISMTERALAECAEQFPAALGELRSRIASPQ